MPRSLEEVQALVEEHGGCYMPGCVPASPCPWCLEEALKGGRYGPRKYDEFVENNRAAGVKTPEGCGWNNCQPWSLCKVCGERETVNVQY